MPFLTSLLPLLQGGSGEQPAANPLVQFLPLILIIGIFWFLILRPQARERKAQEAMRSDLKKGDRVLTQGGIIGRVGQIKDAQITLEIDGAKMTVVRNAVVERLDAGGDAGGAPTPKS